MIGPAASKSQISRPKSQTENRGAVPRAVLSRIILRRASLQVPEEPHEIGRSPWFWRIAFSIKFRVAAHGCLCILTRP